MDSNDFAVELAFNKSLEVLKNVGSFLKEIDPREFTIVINETDVIRVSTNRSGCWAPNIGKISCKGFVDTLVETRYGS